MKNISKYILYFVAVMFIFTACEKDVLEPLTGKYLVPEEYPLTKLIAQKAVKNEGRRFFTLQLATGNVSATYNEATDSYTYSGSGQFLSVVFVENDYYLKDGNYTLAPNSAPKIGCYIAGYNNAGAGTCFFNVNNGTATGLMVSDGTISVKKNGNSYTIGGMLALSDKSIVTVNFAGNIIYEEDPPEMTYSLTKQVPYSYSQGGPPITVPGSQLNQISIFSDGALIAYIEIVTAENPTSLSGNYPITDPATAIGQACNGFYIDLSWWGMAGVMQGGSYVIGDDGVTKLYIRGGTISVTDKADVLTIMANNLPLQDISNGNFGNLPFTGVINAPNATRAINYTYEVAVEAPAMGGNAFAPVPIADSQLNKITVYADGALAGYFEVVTAENATSLAGTYTVKDEKNATGQMSTGISIPAWFVESGSYYMQGGQKMFIRENPGGAPAVTFAITDNKGVLSIVGNEIPVQDVANINLDIFFFPNLPDKGSVNFTNIVKK